jgi:hypothetical protein
MSNMSNLDIVLSKYKLSDAQKNAVVELLSPESGIITAKANTLKSLGKRGLVTSYAGGGWQLPEEFRAELEGSYTAPEAREEIMGLPVEVKILPVYRDGYDLEVPEVREVKSLAASQGIVLTDQEAFEVSQESVESLLQGDPWKMGDAITADEAYIVLDSDGELKDAEGTEFDKFDSKWNDLFKETSGFGATLDWRGVEVWDGLTAAEIKEDMETASPINRKARRTHFRTLRNAFRRANVERPRKALKLTGAKGL